jgi:glyoxylase-like metal-dependent hydrolase (beta-lactamase superfamily II)
MSCYPLSENSYTVDNLKVFVPFTRGVDDVRSRPGSLLVDICPFLITIETERIVLDPGLGLKLDNSQYHIEQNLATHNLTTSNVTMVLLSHLHKDHIGGCFKEHDGRFELMFPNATHYAQQGELEYALGKGSKSYEQNKIQFLLNSNKLVLLQGNGSISVNIRYEVSGGHTPYHQVFFIDDGSDKFFFGGDVVPQVKQVQFKYVAKYDYDGILSAELRQQFAQQLIDQNRVALFFHSTDVPMARLRFDGDKVAFDKV